MFSLENAHQNTQDFYGPLWKVVERSRSSFCQFDGKWTTSLISRSVVTRTKCPFERNKSSHSHTNGIFWFRTNRDWIVRKRMKKTSFILSCYRTIVVEKWNEQVFLFLCKNFQNIINRSMRRLNSTTRVFGKLINENESL